MSGVTAGQFARRYGGPVLALLTVAAAWVAAPMESFAQG
jgi:hypothetical protein